MSITTATGAHVPAVTLARRPDGVPRPEDFAVTTTSVRTPGPGEVRVRALDLSLDPYIRSVLGDGHLAEPALPIGGVVPGTAVAEIVDPGDSGLAIGDLVMASTGWAAEAVVSASGLVPVRATAGVPLSAVLGPLGMPGLTAYAAHVRHVRPQPGETVVVTAATGGVGAVAAALARGAGARTVAVVGSDAKATVALERLGYDAAVVGRRDGWLDALHEACPSGIDGYLHMADQATLDGVAEHLARGARVSLIGLIDQTNGASPTRLRAGAVMAARAVVHGMVVYDHTDLIADQVAAVSAMIQDGSFTVLEDRVHGLEHAPEAFARLMAGENIGKVVVEVAQPTHH
ncbi:MULTISPECIES: MDR family NADP-dependent oxidoreductase [Mumia]|uniref:MDR family NADP-dependent oxidoreductase n=1 Tax=Mumia TaxID=1546255 RepID=UPI00141FE1A4|nr:MULTISPECIES: NADP-dependent oxidoreductase [unclassified Mumia]QMW66260.1 NADP-dependent oxidoreductase [Mumia sp. ZJ1417]